MLQRSATYIMSLNNSVPMAINPYTDPSPDNPSLTRSAVPLDPLQFLGTYDPKNKFPLEVADRIAQAMSIPPGEEMAPRSTAKLGDLGKSLLDEMEKAGFQCFRGQRDTGLATLGLTKNGGF
jgi:hypothetical protein